MGDAKEDRAQAEELPDGDVVRILLEQHARVRGLFAQLQESSASARGPLFDELRALLAVHETGEELVLRPQATGDEWKHVAQQRNEEEKEANRVLSELEDLDPRSEAFLAKLTDFERSVDEHADAEESEEFPRVLATLDADERHKLGDRLLAAETMAPTHPHPSAAGSPVAQALTGPFAAMVDRVRDLMSR